jgi:hypothetical protein
LLITLVLALDERGRAEFVAGEQAISTLPRGVV